MFSAAFLFYFCISSVFLEILSLNHSWMRGIKDEVNDMDKRFFKDFWNKRSAWTFGLCLTGVLAIGSIVAVDKVQQEPQDQPDTVQEQAYLEEGAEDILDPEDVNDTLLTDLDEEEPTVYEDEEINASAADYITAENTDSESTVDEGNPAVDAVNEDTVDMEETAGDNTDTASGQSAEEASAVPEEDTAEAASSNIISETDLLAANVAFDSEASTLLWPAAGTILIDYSMDGSVYFPTLNQYKYNPALIISSDAGNQVLSAARGIVETIRTDEVTGLTMTVNIGNGYRLTYGQLKEAAVQEGNVVEAGDVLGYVSEPTRYYVKEGSNLYFEMTKDGEPVDPVLYLE